MRAILACTLSVLCASIATGHDYWLSPETYFPMPGKPVALRLHVGDQFERETERPFQAKPTLRFDLVDAKKTADLRGDQKDGQEPFARIVPAGTGSLVVRVDRAAQPIKIAADKFNAYLKEEGLDHILKLRRDSGEDRKEGRERYARCLKCLLRVGDDRDKVHSKELGQTLEILLLSDPTLAKVGDVLAVRVLFEKKPLAGVTVFAYRRAKPDVRTQMQATNPAGEVNFKLDGSGEWLVRLVHMRRTKTDAEFDWESWWAAYSFGVNPPSTP